MRIVNFHINGNLQQGVLEGDIVRTQIDDQRLAFPRSEINLSAPVKRPGKIICAAMNYPPHDKEDDWQPPPYPVLFQKPGSSLTGPDTPIVLPKISNNVLYEGELAVVIGRKGNNMAADSVQDYVAGYTIANDVGAADLERRSSQWASGKMFDTFCPLGPALITPDEMPDPGNLHIQTKLNDKVVQDSNTKEMIYDTWFLVRYISCLTTLEPSDVILTGSPRSAGDKPDPRTPLRSGDQINVEIAGLGILSNTVIAEEDIGE